MDQFNIKTQKRGEIELRSIELNGITSLLQFLSNSITNAPKCILTFVTLLAGLPKISPGKEIMFSRGKLLQFGNVDNSKEGREGEIANATGINLEVLKALAVLSDKRTPAEKALIRENYVPFVRAIVNDSVDVITTDIEELRVIIIAVTKILIESIDEIRKAVRGASFSLGNLSQLRAAKWDGVRQAAMFAVSGHYLVLNKHPPSMLLYLASFDVNFDHIMYQDPVFELGTTQPEEMYKTYTVGSYECIAQIRKGRFNDYYNAQKYGALFVPQQRETTTLKVVNIEDLAVSTYNSQMAAFDSEFKALLAERTAAKNVATNDDNDLNQ